MLENHHFDIYLNIFLQWLLILLWTIWVTRVSPKINSIGFGARGHVQKSRNHRNEQFEGSHINKLESYKFKLKRNNTTELLSIYFLTKMHNNCPEIAKRNEHASLSGFFQISYRNPAFFRLCHLENHPDGFWDVRNACLHMFTISNTTKCCVHNLTKQVFESPTFEEYLKILRKS